MKKQSGVVLVFALLVLLSITILGVSAVSSSLMQSRMAQSMESYQLAFDAAEAAIGAVVYESEDSVLLANPALTDPLTEARQDDQFEPGVDNLSCYENAEWTNRRVTTAGLTAGTRHVSSGNYSDQPPVTAWSNSAFVGERSCLGSSNVIGGSNISCHYFVVRGCGQVAGSRYAVANTLNVSVFAPSSSSH